MRISDKEIQKLAGGHYAIVQDIVDFDQALKRKGEDTDLIQHVTAEVIAMPDREELIADLKARIEAGAYKPTGADIADAMIRRSIADHVQG
ncbi:MAG: negative regulator of flagellin synthesis FlgM [Fimbriimonadaceae bacterium]|jgi:negative regulator of flagellin synthesis FlgM|nr:negative regulator of flagellin synthesis FlgM [Fimbriimonadaceae bacterium]